MTAVPRPAPAAHAHAWVTVRFELAGERPVVRQRCEACGAERQYRAWERYWTPALERPAP
jgi:hypothetical protein